MNSQIVKGWKRAAQELDIEVSAPFCLQLKNPELNLTAVIRIKNFGGHNGMLIFNQFEYVESFLESIVDAGFGFTILDEPQCSVAYSVDDYVQLLRDWGWSGNLETRPEWM